MSENAKKPKDVTIEVNNRPVELDSKKVSGAEIKVAAGVPEEFQLFREHGEKLDPVADDDQITVHDGESFRAVSGQDVS